MIEGLAKATNELALSARLHQCFGNDLLDLMTRDDAGTAAQNEIAFSFEQGNSQACEAAIPGQSLPDLRSIAGELRWVEDDQAKSLTLRRQTFEMGEDIRLYPLAIRQAVRGGVSLGQLECGGRHIDSHDPRSSPG